MKLVASSVNILNREDKFWILTSLVCSSCNSLGTHSTWSIQLNRIHHNLFKSTLHFHTCHPPRTNDPNHSQVNVIVISIVSTIWRLLENEVFFYFKSRCNCPSQHVYKVCTLFNHEMFLTSSFFLPPPPWQIIFKVFVWSTCLRSVNQHKKIEH